MERNRKKLKKQGIESTTFDAPYHINNLDDGCLMHIFSLLSPLPGNKKASFFVSVLYCCFNSLIRALPDSYEVVFVRVFVTNFVRKYESSVDGLLSI